MGTEFAEAAEATRKVEQMSVQPEGVGGKAHTHSKVQILQTKLLGHGPPRLRGFAEECPSLCHGKNAGSGGVLGFQGESCSRNCEVDQPLGAVIGADESEDGFDRD